MDRDAIDLAACLESHDYAVIIDYLLDEKGLDYGKLPKGLLKFHDYKTYSRTPVGEHMVEGAHYALDKNDRISLQFTVSPEHFEKFNEEVLRIGPVFEERFEAIYDISFSIQKPSTDTIAADEYNQIFRDVIGRPVFRPGGHGALIENLNDLEADIIFIKNIDNVVPDHLKPETYRYKKVLGGLLLQLQKKVFEYLEELENNNITENHLNEIIRFCKKDLFRIIPSSFEDLPFSDKIRYLRIILDRPIRICGMVKNEGEPGGGPFWVENTHGEISLQIVETSQIDIKDPEQKEILNNATHFNPVDLVCGITNYKGEKFDLRNFVDPETGFISLKSKDGRQLKALELPGLWNGAMAGWITIFVEVPIITFNPVKTVNDLLRDQHQPG
jgi:hypothetical protein